MILEVKKWPESQEVMNKEGWFFITGSNHLEEDEEDVIGNATYARVLDKSEYILVEKTTADEFNEQEAFDDEDTWKETEEFITYGDKKLSELKTRDYGPPYGPHNPLGNEEKI